MAGESKIIEIKLSYEAALIGLTELEQKAKNLTAEQKALNQATTDGAKRHAEISSQLKIVNKDINTLTDSVVKNYKADLARAGVIDRNILAMAKSQAAMEKKAAKETGYINQLRIAVDALEKEYYQLTEAELKSSKGTALLEKLKGQRLELMELQQAYGNHKLNVGHYSSATKMLGINIGQVMKEMPNFAISARTGIMALTNNLPMLVEAIQSVRLEQIAATKAQKLMTAAQIAALPNLGKLPTMFSLISKSIFGLTGLMSILMVLMQLFGGDIIKWVVGLLKGKEAVDTLTKSINELNKISMENMAGDLEKIRLFAHDYNKATREGNAEKIIQLEEIAEKEYGIHKERLKQIGDNVSSWRNAFAEYLKIAKATYFNEALSKAMTEKEMLSQVQKVQQSALVQRVRQQLDKVHKGVAHRTEGMLKIFLSGEMSFLDTLGWGLGGITKEWNTLQNEIKETNTAIRDLRQIPFQDVYSGIQSPPKVITQELITKKSARDTEETVKDFDFYIKTIDAKARAFEDSMQREVEVVRAAIGKKKKEASDYILYLEGLVNKKNKDAKAKITQAKIDEAELQKSLTEQGQREEFAIIEKYIDKRNALAADLVAKSLQALDESLALDEYLGERSIENQLKLADIKRQNQANYFADMLDLSKGNIDAESAMRLQQLDFQMRQELAAANLTEKQRLAITEKYAALRSEVEKNVWTARLAIAEQVTLAIVQLFGKEHRIGKAAAAATVGIQSAQSAFSLGTQSIKYFVGVPPLIPPNPIMGLFALTQAALVVANGVKSISAIYATEDPEKKISISKSTVKEKFHTGTYRPSSQNEEKEITRTLLTTERVLSPTQTQIFDGILSTIRSYGNAQSITKNVGVSGSLQEQTMTRAFSKALMNMPAPVISWSEFQTQAQRMLALENNRFIR